MRFDPGTRVRVEMTKWPDRPHWVFEGSYLGTDEHGDWIAFAAGSRYTRPGMDVTTTNHQVGLVPAGSLAERGWLAAFHGPGGTFSYRLYVDVATPPVWEGTTLRSVDLDLDVVHDLQDRVWVEDEDEFEDHRVRYDYPERVVVQAIESCRSVEAAVRRQAPPFDGETHLPWLHVLAAD